ncbi:MAG: alpha/beta hydrolase [Candidatus Kariarchaeaceae archaeon]|jgi:pimeloyl-ACP methyl ester carboxylesterase
MVLLAIFYTLTISIAVVLVLYILSIIAIGEIYFRLSRHRSYPINPKALGAERVILTDNKGCKITGWYYPTKRKKLAIVIHGHFDNAGMMFERYVPIFTDVNWDVFVLDLRNHGLSDDDFPLTYGVRESIDVRMAIAWAHQRNKWEKFVVFGTSMGSIAGLLAARSTRLHIDGVVLDSPFVSIEKTLSLNLQKHRIPISLYVFPLIKYMEIRYRQKRYSFQFYPDIEQVIRDVSTKFSLFIARGKADREVAIEDFHTLKDLITSGTYIHVPWAMHSKLYYSQTYVDALQKWLSKL